ncbi:SIMPL domain-containing protein [Robertmurraya sp. P23]|uniref:SIMPL domain-containing protein n=1 Tax=Robertmurraya sp. P23 TaxID=3436931 RepID=UPI003D9513EF
MYQDYTRVWNHYPARATSTNEIRVIGEGTVDIQPDQADVIIGIITENKELVPAQRENAQVSSAVVDALLSLQIPREKIRTSDYSIFPQYDFVDGVQTFRNYKVEHRLTVTLSNMDQIGMVVDKAIESGANSILAINFSAKNRLTQEQQALTLAVHDATQKAAAIAQAIRVQLNHPPILIIEGGSAVTIPEPLYTTMPMVKGVSTTIEPGLLQVKATITAVFQFTS